MLNLLLVPKSHFNDFSRDWEWSTNTLMPEVMPKLFVENKIAYWDQKQSKSSRSFFAYQDSAPSIKVHEFFLSRHLPVLSCWLNTWTKKSSRWFCRFRNLKTETSFFKKIFSIFVFSEVGNGKQQKKMNFYNCPALLETDDWTLQGRCKAKKVWEKRFLKKERWQLPSLFAVLGPLGFQCKDQEPWFFSCLVFLKAVNCWINQ